MDSPPRVLITSAHAPQAYSTIRALRRHSDKIIVGGYKTRGPLGGLPHAAYSRLVDKRYRIPSPVADWQRGHIRRENSDREEAYVAALLAICEREEIDFIFPCWDPDVYVLSKNKERFAQRAVVIPVPDYEIALSALDKYRSILAAEATGFPCPRTYLYQTEQEALDVADREGLPLVIKPRFTSGSRGMAIVHSKAELLDRLDFEPGGDYKPMLQEYIPGGTKQSVQFVIDRQGQSCFAFHKKRIRSFRINARFGAVSESAEMPPYYGHVVDLMKSLNWWGVGGLEVMHDPRDGIFKLMEINARFPRQLWNRTEIGINEPLMCLDVAQGRECASKPTYPAGLVFVNPIEDALLLGLQFLDLTAYRVRGLVRGEKNVDQRNAPLPLSELITTYLGTYRRGRKRVYDPYSRYFLQDPLVSVIWWMQFGTWILGAFKQIGR